jgi:cell division protein FtsW
VDPFGALLVSGFTSWVAIQSLLNIAVMTAVVPSSGLPLPFISYGGSALLVLMVGFGLILSVARVSVQRRVTTKRRQYGATADRRWRDGRTHLSRTGRRGGAA